MPKDAILVVDDERNIVDLLRMYLEQEGFRVESANDGGKALAMIDRQRPALVILDLMLPGLDGWEVCRRLRANAPTADLPILMLTARDDDVDKIVGLELAWSSPRSRPSCGARRDPPSAARSRCRLATCGLTRPAMRWRCAASRSNCAPRSSICC
jgi:CheY-like chemotaxis protein